MRWRAFAVSALLSRLFEVHPARFERATFGSVGQRSLKVARSPTALRHLQLRHHRNTSRRFQISHIVLNFTDRARDSVTNL